MASPLPRLRPDLDIMPSPVAEQPGLLVRDPFHYSEATLIIPPGLARGLGCFDGENTELDLRAVLARRLGRVDVSEPARHLVTALHDAGFLDDEKFAELREQRHTAFAAAPTRTPAHAGSGYPDEPAPLATTLTEYLSRTPTKRPPAKKRPLVGIAAPHVSPEGGVASYAAAYRALSGAREDRDDGLAERTFVILGTSHYGAPDRLGLTRKPFETPFGVTQTDARLVDALARDAGDAALVEDYCHAVEHSIEFQVVFLQHLFGPRVRILPVLCGAFVEGPAAGKPPEANDTAARALDALASLAAREGDRLFFVLGVDMAHVGRRYGDAAAARADEGELVEVAARDRGRIASLEAGDAEGFWEQVRERGTPERGYDDLKWCGSAPFYAFHKAVPAARGQLLHYEQWNIDDASVVSFGAIAYRG
ncbi:MAG TPA: AmmeMemoRadiSam system protein B [Polyangia bacterium]|nr:AmmeMemoRadiSam system protein B [Polyangia bacterium]